MFKTISPLGQENAQIIADDWHYEGEYAFYDMENDPEDYAELVSPELRGNHYFQVTDQGQLVAFFGLFPLSENEVEVGLGLRPDRTGKGLGSYLLEKIEDFVLAETAYRTIQLSVAEFNARAIRLYQKSGYEEVRREMVATNGGHYPFIILKKEIKES